MQMAANKPTDTFSIRLGDDLRVSLERLSAMHGVSVAEIVRLCVKGMLPSVSRCYAAMQAEVASMEKIQRATTNRARRRIATDDEAARRRARS